MAKILFLLLAGISVGAHALESAPPPAIGEKPFFTGSNAHQYLGLATLGAGVLTALAPKEKGGLHENAAYATVGLAAAAVITGMIFNNGDITPAYGLKDPDNLHALLALAGTLLVYAAVANGGEDGHSLAGVTGIGSMFYAVKIVW